MVTREWLREGTTVYTLKPNDRRRSSSSPEFVNDVTMQIHSHDAEDAKAAAAEVHRILTEYPALKARIAELEARDKTE